MKRLTPSHIAKEVRAWVEGLREQRFFRDRLSLALLVPTFALNIVTLGILIFRLHPSDFAVPVHYSNLNNGFDALGPWYQTYSIAIFGLLVTAVNTVLASISFNHSRITSFYLMIGAFVVALFSLIIGTAFAVLV